MMTHKAALLPHLKPDEQSWLDDYLRVLDEKFPGVVDDVIIYGSKARGDAREDSDLDVLLLIKEGDWRAKKAMQSEGYSLEFGKDVVASILIYTQKEWGDLEELESVYRENVLAEGISVWHTIQSIEVSTI